MIAKISIIIIIGTLLLFAYFDWAFLQPRKKKWWWRLLWGLPILFIAATLQQAEEKDFVPDDIEKLFAYFDLLFVIAFPWAMFCLCSIIGRLFKKAKAGRNVGIAMAIICAATYLYGRHIGFYELEVKRVDLSFSDLPPAFEGYRIVQFSDAHLGTYTGPRKEILQRAVDSINSQKADVVVFTGDLQNKLPYEIEPHMNLLSKIKAPDGVYSVLGNHDYSEYTNRSYEEEFENRELTKTLQEEMGWRLLTNGHNIVRRGQDSIIIAGMENDSEGRFPQFGNIQHTLWGVSRSAFVVMLEHDPTAWRRKILPQCHAQLTLSGHTHGGQFHIFGWSPTNLEYKEAEGLHQAGQRKIYVSKGLGGVIPIRIGCPGEIVVITLHRKQQS